jgi:hypothetical protein
MFFPAEPCSIFGNEVQDENIVRKQMLKVLSAFAVVLLVSSGCKPKLPPKPQTYPVHGTVTLQGSPVHGGEIEFMQVDMNAGGIEGRSVISKDGTYNASSFVDQPGMVPGEYKVRLKQYVGLPGSLGVEPTTIPKKYLEYGAAELKYTIKPEDNQIDINLE